VALPQKVADGIPEHLPRTDDLRGVDWDLYVIAALVGLSLWPARAPVSLGRGDHIKKIHALQNAINNRGLRPVSALLSSPR
jgi:hypothetical protein